AGPTEQDPVRRQLGPAGPDLLPPDTPATVDLRRPGPQRRQVGARIRLREQLTPDLFAGEDWPQIPPLLRLGPEMRDGRPGEVLADGVEPLRRPGQVAFVVEDRAHPLVQALPAVLTWPGQTRVPGLEQHQLPGAPERRLLGQI